MKTAPRMTRAHYEYLADMFGQIAPWPTTLEVIADHLEETSPKFDRAKFIKRATKKWEDSHDGLKLDDEIPY